MWPVRMHQETEIGRARSAARADQAAGVVIGNRSTVPRHARAEIDRRCSGERRRWLFRLGPRGRLGAKTLTRYLRGCPPASDQQRRVRLSH